MTAFAYILDDENRPVACDAATWGRWFSANTERRIVAQTDLGLVWVSTVFLGIDHRFRGGGPPLLFETMVFASETHTVTMPGGGSYESHADLYGVQDRYASWDDAATGHAVTVKRVKQKLAESRAAAERAMAATGKKETDC